MFRLVILNKGFLYNTNKIEEISLFLHIDN